MYRHHGSSTRDAANQREAPFGRPRADGIERARAPNVVHNVVWRISFPKSIVITSYFALTINKGKGGTAWLVMNFSDPLCTIRSNRCTLVGGMRKPLTPHKCWEACSFFAQTEHRCPQTLTSSCLPCRVNLKGGCCRCMYNCRPRNNSGSQADWRTGRVPSCESHEDVGRSRWSRLGGVSSDDGRRSRWSAWSISHRFSNPLALDNWNWNNSIQCIQHDKNYKTTMKNITPKYLEQQIEN